MDDKEKNQERKNQWAAIITARVLTVSKPIARDTGLGLKPFREHWKQVWQHISGCGEGHAVTVVRDALGAQVYACCCGSYLINRDEIADPFLFEIEDPRAFLASLCEHLSDMDERERALGI